MNDWNFSNRLLNNPEQSNYCIFAPDSKAEILYWFSRDDIPKQQKEAFIRVLVNFDDGCGGFYRYRAYFLAAEALHYFPECSLGDAIVEQLLNWSYLYFGWQLFPQLLVEAARKTLEVTDKKRVIKAFELLLRHTPSRLTLQSAATKLGELDAGNKMAIAALILLLDVTQDNCRRSTICRSIAKIGVGNQAAISTVINFMETTEDKNLCSKAIETLGKIGCGNQTAILALERFLQINRGDRICLDAAKALLLIDAGNEVAKDALVFILENSASETTDTFYLLGEVAALLLIIQPEIIATLENQLRIDRYTYLIRGFVYNWSDSYVVNMQSLDEIASSHCEYEPYASMVCVEALIDNKIAMKSLAVKSLLEKVFIREISFFQFEEKATENGQHFHYDDSFLLNSADRLKQILQQEHFPRIITALKEYLGEQSYKSSSYRYDGVYKLIWHCAENMSYQDFFKAWHG
ncbi:MAG: HEAT repeat domain-containing protein [Nostocales cyanobacterium 94392]|nr:HEAT repeat domain-containing protein [Nostocales cyanobacterium 94392]